MLLTLFFFVYLLIFGSAGSASHSVLASLVEPGLWGSTAPGLQSSGSAAGARGSAAPQQVGSVHMVHGALEARMLKWIAIPLSSGPRLVRTLHHDSSILGGPTQYG